SRTHHAHWTRERCRAIAASLFALPIGETNDRTLCRFDGNGLSLPSELHGRGLPRPGRCAYRQCMIALREATMSIGLRIAVGLSLSIAVLGIAVSISAQDKDTVKVPNGLSFAEFKGYEGWPVIAISGSGEKIAAIVGNPAMIDAYKAGVPANGN